jgi:hypothetical protein
MKEIEQKVDTDVKQSVLVSVMKMQAKKALHLEGFIE